MGNEARLGNFALERAPEIKVESAIENRTKELYEDIHPYEVVEKSIRIYLTTLGITEQFFRGKDIVDCGFGGTGWASELFARAGAKSVSGIDLNDHWRARLQERLKDYGVPLDLRTGNVLALPWADNSFDYAHSYGVMMVTADWKKGISEMVRVVRPGGTIFLMMYGKYGFLGELIRLTYRGLGKVVPYRMMAWIVKKTGLLRSPSLSILDAMYVPISVHLSERELVDYLKSIGLVNIRPFENTKWKNSKFLANPLMFGRKINHNIWASKTAR